MPERPNGAVSKTDGHSNMARAFDSLSFRQINLAVAQLEERRATNAEAMGSTPVSEANSKYIYIMRRGVANR